MPKQVWERQCFKTEGLEANVVNSRRGNSSPSADALLLKAPDQVIDNDVGDGEQAASCDDTNITERASPSGGQDKISVFVSGPKNGTVNEKDNISSSGAEVVNTKVSSDIDDEDAICRRTRARYSLASFTLDELETFLQETDDEDDLQNVDDEEEYRKFLAAVLHGDNNDMAEQGTENVYDEDEDNDADFELEIEEALESDVDENLRLHAQIQNYEGGGRRPETRQNKRLKTSGRLKKKSSAHLNMPLRPLLPNVPVLPFATVHNKHMLLVSAQNSPSPSAFNGIVNGFTPHQIGQLHCLIYEHVQLLIQVYTLCVFESSKENIATQVKGLISEMLQNRDQVLTSRRAPYPSFCFFPPYVRPSLPHKLTQDTSQSSGHGSERDCPVGNNITVPSNPCSSRHQYVPSGNDDGLQAKEGPIWMPYINGHVMSILDVAPLNLVKSYMEDVSIAVKEYKRRHVGDNSDTRFEKEPLFPLEALISCADEVPGCSKALHQVPSYGSDQGPKKTLAGVLVERTKKQSVAPVPKQIAKLAQSFFHLFNRSLFPHKPPSTSIANRVLFTEAEDMLLASGLMEYNTDWKAIQQHFLPCKSKHQIFVRQKNRTCSRAPENPIKAVRRFKNSPLTAEETARIREGLKIWKLDWMSVWKFVVPYRDPSLLPRQWRIATGTQKSYKVDEHKKEKRRLYELRRREGKYANLGRAKSSSEKEDCSAGEENNSGNDCMDNDNEAYVHEAFLADWRPDASSVSLELPPSTCEVEPIPSNFLSPEGCQTSKQTNSSGPGDLQTDQQFSATLKHSQPLASSQFSRANIVSVSQLNNPFSDMLLKSSRSQPLLPPPQAHTKTSSRLVKLSPDLPPVNLPPSVRVMSQSAFKNYQGRTSNIVSSSQSCFTGPSTPNSVPKLLNVSNSATAGPMTAGHNNSIPSQSCISHSRPEASISRNKVIAEDQDGSDLQMHPLLFQTPDDRHLPYYPLNRGTNASSSFNYFPRNQPLLNLSLLHNPKQANYTLHQSGMYTKSVEKISPSIGIDFHPLLQRCDDVNSNIVTAHPAAEPSLPENLSGSQHVQSRETFDAGQTDVGSLSTVAILSTPNRKAAELDLDIHLSCTSRKQKSGESRDPIRQSTIRRPPTGDSGIIQSKNSANPSKHLSGSSQEAIPPGLNKNNDSGARADNQSNQDSGDHPEIVMEQEELSDSEEENTEDVEFECEEMTDSEGEEGSEIEQMYSMGIEELPNHLAKKAMAGDSHNQHQH